MINKKIEKSVQQIKGRTYPGSSTRDGKMYHDLPFEGMDKFSSHRGRTRERINNLTKRFNPKGKRILDIGCSVGGLSLGMAENGAKYVLGVDYDLDSIKIAQTASQSLRMDDRTEFKAENITIEWAKSLEHFDVIIWLSQWMWIVKQKGMEYAKELLFEVSRHTDAMFFESAADDGMARIKGSTQDDIEKWLKENTVFRKFKRYPPVGGWMHRDGFYLYKPLLKFEPGKRSTTSTIERISAPLIKKTFQKEWKWQAAREIKAYKRLEKFGRYPKVHAYNEEEGSIIIDYMGACEWLEFDNDKYKEQALEMLKELKSVGIEHRDIKHSNIMELNGKICLIDFGWAIFDDETDSPVKALKSMHWRQGRKDEERMKGMFGIKD